MTINTFVKRIYFVNEFESANDIMTSSFLKNQYANVFELVQIVNEFIKDEKYVVIIKNFKHNKKEIKTTIYFCCIRDQKIKESTNTKNRNFVFKRTNCSFQIVAKFENNM